MTSPESDHDRDIKAEFRARCHHILSSNIHDQWFYTVSGPNDVNVGIATVGGNVSVVLMHYNSPMAILFQSVGTTEHWDLPLVVGAGLQILRNHMVLDDLAKT